MLMNHNFRYVHSAGLRMMTPILLMPGLLLAQAIVKSPPQTSTMTTGYWTPARRAAATPMALRSASGTPSPAPASMLNRSTTPGFASGNLPAGVAADSNLESSEPMTAATTPMFGTGSTVWYSYPPPSTLTRPTLDYIAVPLYPNTTLGKLFFTVPGGVAVCSAQSVTSAGSWGAGKP